MEKTAEFIRPGASVLLASAFAASRVHFVNPERLPVRGAPTVCGGFLTRPHMIGHRTCLSASVLGHPNTESQSRLNAKIYCVACLTIYFAQMKKAQSIDKIN